MSLVTINCGLINSNEVNKDTFNTNDAKYFNKSIKIYKSNEWEYFTIKIHYVPYKHVFSEKKINNNLYYIEMREENGMPSLLCDNAIIYQQNKWFKFTVEITLKNGVKRNDANLYSCIINNFH